MHHQPCYLPIRLKSLVLLLLLAPAWLLSMQHLATAQQSGVKAQPLTFGPLPDGVKPDRLRLASWDIHKNFRFQWHEVTTAKDAHAVMEVTIPAGHQIFTVVINDAHGVRVRNLVSMGNVKDYGGDPASGEPQKVRVAWNGLDDKGNPAIAGTYRVDGLSLPRPTAEFDYAWYNPGDPPWQGYQTSGWGGDHSGPTGVACVPAGSKNKWRVVLTWPVVESPHATIALDENHRKVWGFKRAAGFDGSRSVAIADGHLWLGVRNELIVLKLDSATSRGWDSPTGKKTAIDLKRPIDCVSVGPAYVAVLLGTAKDAKTHKIVFLDKQAWVDPKAMFSLQVEMEQPTTSIAFAPHGKLYASTKTGVVIVDAKGSTRAVALSGLEKPGAIAFDPHGNLFVMDLGADYQVKVYSPALQLLHTIGTKGGQPVSHPGYFWTIPAKADKGLAYDAGAMHSVEALAIDEFGQLWVAEGNPHPRRVAVFGKDGKFVRQFVGCTSYGAGNTLLHCQDPKRGFSGGILFEVDPSKTNSYRPIRYLTSGPAFTPPAKGAPNQRLDTQVQAVPFTEGQLFRSDASGKMHEYYLSTLPGYPVIFREKNGDYQPVAAIGTSGATKGILALPEFVKKPGTVYVWSDVNEDGLVQAEEVQALPAGGNGRIADFYGWNYLIQPDLVFYVNGFAVPPVRFTPSGTPIYDGAKARKLKENDLFLRVGKHLVGTSGAGPFQVGAYKFADIDGKTMATFPLVAMGVHSAEHSRVPEPGQTVGELYFIGTADIGGEVGSVVATIGDMGQVFLFTEDGMYLCTLFRDTRTNPPGYPAKAVKGADYTHCTLLGEAFGTWFGKQDDGKIRILFGRNEATVCQIKGLDQVLRLPTSHIQLSSNVRVTGAPPRQPDQATPIVVPKIPQTDPVKIRVDGGLGDWRGIPSYKILAGDIEAGTVQVAHDGASLFLAYRVLDSSPLQNKAQDERAYFKEGDCVELRIGPFRKVPQPDPIAGDLRLIFVPTGPSPSAILYRAIAPGAKESDKVKLTSPIGTTVFDSVAKMSGVELVFSTAPGGYVCEARVPLKSLGINYSPGLNLRGDIGMLFSDPGGQSTQTRAYIFNRNRTTTADLSEEAKLLPELWGTIVLE
ncbi:MAG: hypothetical protein FJ271_26080 [Planctomycetes bacterium]|nr:hypothetical protein [Planctomycetota bacterium]